MSTTYTTGTPAGGHTHTPGPWKALHTPTKKDSHWAIVTENSAPVQAVIAFGDSHSKAYQGAPELAEANARLIAAAPELLTALLALFDECTVYTNGNADMITTPISLVSGFGIEAWSKARAAISKAQGGAL